jgi:hypothetical protein
MYVHRAVYVLFVYFAQISQNQTVQLPKLFLRGFFVSDRLLVTPTYKCKEHRRKQKMNNNFPFPGQVPGINQIQQI